MPNFQPGRWNVFPVLWQNNCYNYALNRVDTAFRNPGDLSGQPPLAKPQHVDAHELARRAESDGLIRVADAS